MRRIMLGPKKYNGIDVDRVLNNISQLAKNASNPEFRFVKAVLAVIRQIAIEGDTTMARALLVLVKERLISSKVFESRLSELRAEIEDVENKLN